MRKVLILLILSLYCHGSEILDLGNLDVKGEVSLPKYTYLSSALNLKSSLMKIASISYEKEIDTRVDMISNTSRNNRLVEDSDFVFDMSINKPRLD